MFYEKKSHGDCSCGHTRSPDAVIAKGKKKPKRINRDRPKVKRAAMKLQKAVMKMFDGFIKRGIEIYKGELKKADREDDFDFSVILDEYRAGIDVAVADSVGQTIGQMEAWAGVDVIDSFGPKMVQRASAIAFESGAARMAESGEFTRERFRSELSSALERGLSTESFADELKDSYNFSIERARTIARTEIITAHVSATAETYREAGVKKKSWLLAQDDFCDECQANADQGAIPFDDAFADGSDMPPAHPNCRCDLGAEFEGWDMRSDSEIAADE
jgi:SPP1 gp7 family putative phage head morphogenesis protein